MNRSDLLAWLGEEDDHRLAELWRRADAARQAAVGDRVHLRGLLELGNYCVRACAYCGIRADNRRLKRYRLTEPEISAGAGQAAAYGYGTVVMQSGEDYRMSRDFLSGVIRRIKTETPLAVTLSLGERPPEDLAAWRQAGADRYLLRFETSDRELYDRIHPPLHGRRSDRVAILRTLRELGYEIGSGVMIGIPGQTYSSLTQDLELFRELDLDMIGVGPFLPHPDTPLVKNGRKFPTAPDGQVPNTELMTYKVVALARLLCPQANIPATTALATLNREHGRELGLTRGANVVMPNLTPPEYRKLYEIYPAKACISETAEAFHQGLRERILALGRTLGEGPGGRRRAGSN